MSERNGNGNGTVTGIAKLANTLGLWIAVITIGAFVYNGGVSQGKASQKVETLEDTAAALRDEMKGADQILNAGIMSLADKISKVQQIAAADDERIRQIKETTDEIKQDLKTLIREIRRPPPPSED